MHSDFWLSRWREGRTGFHRDVVHEDLIRFADRFLGDGPHRVLVPLCGKTLDLHWLAAQGHEAVGIELSPIAAEAVFEGKHGVEEDTLGPFVRRRSGRLTVLQGDVFDATPELLGPIDRVWDRAAVVALDPGRRQRYAVTISALLRPGGLLLQNAFEYDQEKMDGPPFSVSTHELAALYAGWPREELLREALTEGKFKERGLDSFVVTRSLFTRP